MSDDEVLIPESVKRLDQTAYMITDGPVLGMVLPGEDGYDCPDCVLGSPSKRSYPEGVKGLIQPCSVHARQEVSGEGYSRGGVSDADVD